MEPGTLEASALLVGRDRELEAVTASLQTAARGEGSVVVVTGAAGVGKSTLLAAATARARGLGLSVYQARGSELEQDLPFGVIRQLFELRLRSAPPAERERLLSGAAATASRLLVDAPLAYGPATDGGFATLHGLYWLAYGLAAERPLMVVVDDGHWADVPSLRALSYLAGRIADLPIALIVALRPHEPSSGMEILAGLKSDLATRHVEPQELGLTAVAAIVCGDIPDADDELCAAFYESSAGNPLYVRELLRSAATAGATPTPDAVREAALASVAERVMRRVAALGPDALPLAAAMAVLGSGGRLREAAAVANQNEPDAADAARAMRRIEILAADDPFEWIHPLVWRSIYDALTVTERDELHARAAKVLGDAGAPPGVIAAHFSALRPASSSRVVAALLAAADEALALDAPEISVTLLRRALEEQAPDPPRPTLLLKLGQIEVMRRNPEAGAILLEARELSADPRERAFAAMGVGESCVFAGRWDLAAEISEQMIQESDLLDDELVLEVELVRALVCAFDPALVSVFREQRPRLQALAQGKSWPARALSAALAETSAYFGEPADQVLPLCEHAIADGVLIGERGAGAFASGHVALSLVTIEEYDRALAFADELERAARAQGSVANALIVTTCRGCVALLRGDLVRAEELLRSVIDTAAQNGILLLLVNVLFFMTDLIGERPAQEDLVTSVESLELPPAFMEASGGGWLCFARGQLRAARGARDEAVADLRRAATIFGRLGVGPAHAPFRSALALVLTREDRDEARALIEEELALADANGLVRPRGIALRAAGLVAGGEEGVERLRESVAVLSGSPLRYEHARSLVELGALLRRTGRRADARAPLAEGVELAFHCGAERLLRQAREELLTTGARPRRIVRSGFDALTASERRIARLAAEGGTNAEIAQALYLSVKTVETHLSSAYRRLGISGPGARLRLAEIVAQPDQAFA